MDDLALNRIPTRMALISALHCCPGLAVSADTGPAGRAARASTAMRPTASAASTPRKSARRGSAPASRKPHLCTIARAGVGECARACARANNPGTRRAHLHWRVGGPEGGVQDAAGVGRVASGGPGGPEAALRRPPRKQVALHQRRKRLRRCGARVSLHRALVIGE